MSNNVKIKIRKLFSLSPLIRFFVVSSFSSHSFLSFGSQYELSKNEINTINEVLDVVYKNYPDAEASRDKMIQSSIRGILKTLDDNADFFNNNQYKDIKNSIQGHFLGIGLFIKKNDNGNYYVASVENESLNKNSIRSGDLILKINDDEISQMTVEEISQKIRSHHKEVNLTILRDGKNLNFRIQKYDVRHKSVSAKLNPSQKILGIKIHYFNDITYNQIMESICKINDEFNKKNSDSNVNFANSISGIILDLRDNPGGSMTSAVKVSDLFLKNDSTIVSLIDSDNNVVANFEKSSNKDEVKDEKYKIFIDMLEEKPLVVIGNKNSASGAEIVIAAIQENKRGVFVGQKTFGKGTVQEFKELITKPGSAIKVTTSRYISPYGNKIDKSGITPNFKCTNQSDFKSKDVFTGCESNIALNILKQL